ncbi:M57 family metalloprotease [Flavivirga abyssicola]|uniref:M57 family metalloprotease n=1 Tax=Flavivirga abyssicola TaxID=3063533 RepID=UPI0026E09812|nr:M57 family metalloprotease [Flavivirga sp. MEBiC07777]WVK12791.1 M57 family metalloprotease [Flavivirga sp. MEBiC07777]
MIALSFVFALNSCEKEEGTAISEESGNFEATITDLNLSKTQIAVLKDNLVIPENSTVQQLEGTFLGRNINGLLIDDNFVASELFDQWLNADSNTEASKGSIMKNRVSFPANGKRTLKIGIVSQGFQSLNAVQLESAIESISRYNSLNMAKIQYTYRLGSASQLMQDQSLNQVIFNDTNNNFVGNPDGRAQFPVNGNPGFLLGLNNRTRNYTKKQNTVLIQHEMGHTLGLVHSDYLTRRSCDFNGTDVNPNLVEGIPNTINSGNHLNSIMRACGFFRYINFRGEDIVGLRNAYNGNF